MDCLWSPDDNYALLQKFFLETLEWGEREFNILRLVSSWGTLNPDEDMEAMRERRHGFSKISFDVSAPCCKSSWEGHGDSMTSHVMHQQTNRSPDEVNASKHNQILKLDRKTHVRLGRMAKRILDWGRILYLRERSFAAKLMYYIDSTVTPENVILVGKRRFNKVQLQTK
eukprot:gene6734-9462_t